VRSAARILFLFWRASANTLEKRKSEPTDRMSSSTGRRATGTKASAKLRWPGKALAAQLVPVACQKPGRPIARPAAQRPEGSQISRGTPRAAWNLRGGLGPHPARLPGQQHHREHPHGDQAWPSQKSAASTDTALDGANVDATLLVHLVISHSDSHAASDASDSGWYRQSTASITGTSLWHLPGR